MTLPNKLTLTRVILALLIIIILLFPFDTMGLSLPKLFINEVLVVDTKYIITGVLFVIASITDIFDGYFAKKMGLNSEKGLIFDAIADKILVNSVLIILCAYGFVHPIIVVTIVIRDAVIDAVRMLVGDKDKSVSSNKTGKIKTILLMIGISLTLLYNLPFELWNLRISDFILIIASVLSVVSGIEYYGKNKKYLFEK